MSYNFVRDGKQFCKIKFSSNTDKKNLIAHFCFESKLGKYVPPEIGRETIFQKMKESKTVHFIPRWLAIQFERRLRKLLK